MIVFASLNNEQRELLKINSQITTFKLKAPLYLVTLGAGLLVSYTISFIKGMTSSLQAEGLKSPVFYLFITLVVIAAAL